MGSKPGITVNRPSSRTDGSQPDRSAAVRAVDQAAARTTAQAPALGPSLGRHTGHQTSAGVVTSPGGRTRSGSVAEASLPATREGATAPTTLAQVALGSAPTVLLVSESLLRMRVVGTSLWCAAAPLHRVDGRAASTACPCPVPASAAVDRVEALAAVPQEAAVARTASRTMTVAVGPSARAGSGGARSHPCGLGAPLLSHRVTAPDLRCEEQLCTAIGLSGPYRAKAYAALAPDIPVTPVTTGCVAGVVQVCLVAALQH